MAEIPIKKGLFYNPEKPGENPYLIGSRCRVCSYICFPEKKVCVQCRRDDTMETKNLGRYGRLDTFTVMRVGTPEFPAPYIIGYVMTDEGALVFTQITGCEANDDALEIGEKMELVIDCIKEDGQGNKLMGWKYRPVRGKGR